MVSRHFVLLHVDDQRSNDVGKQWRIYIVKFWTRAPPGGPNSFNFMQFLGKFGKIVCWCPLESWRPLLGEILDPPLASEPLNQ